MVFSVVLFTERVPSCAVDTPSSASVRIVPLAFSGLVVSCDSCVLIWRIAELPCSGPALALLVAAAVSVLISVSS